MSIKISLEGKNVLVTGGGNGIGRALCKTLHSQNAKVFALCRNQEWLNTLQEECPGTQTICVDLENWEETKIVLRQLPVMDCLVNNAGVGIAENFMATTSHNYDKVMNVNVKAVINVSQEIVQKMLDVKKPGNIVNVSSMSSLTGTPQSVTYAVSKAALDMLTKSMAVELGKHGIRVNSVNPTVVMGTQVSKTLFESQYGEFIKKACIGRTPMGRLCNFDEVINTILFLLSDLAPMIHGEQVFLDGGFRRF